jgi:hypothetical protein
MAPPAACDDAAPAGRRLRSAALRSPVSIERSSMSAASIVRE